MKKNKKHHNISQIKNIISLKELAQYDEIIRYTCKKAICKKNYNDIDSDCIVNDMYIKMDRYFKINDELIKWENDEPYDLSFLTDIEISKWKVKGSRVFDAGYIHNCMKSIFLNKVKKMVHDNVVIDVEEPENDDKWMNIDNKMFILDNILNNLLTPDEIIFYKYIKVNTQINTAIYFKIPINKVKIKNKEIKDKLLGAFDDIQFDLE